MSKQPGLNKSPGDGSATKKTSFGPNRARKAAPRMRGSDVFILAAGIVLFVAVVAFIAGNEMKKRSSSNQAKVESVAKPAPESSSAVESETPQTADRADAEASDSDDTGEACIGCMSQPQMVLTARPDESSLRLPGGEDLRGRWVARMPDATAEAVFDQARFQIIYAGRAEGGIRRYARGYYSYDDTTGVLSLKPAYKEPEPDPIPGVIYQVLTLRYFDVIVRTDSGAAFQYWTAPPEMLASRQIFPLLSFTGVEDNPYLVWEKVQ